MKMNNIISLFDGMSCGQIALKELGILPDTYYASEIDKHAIKTTMHNFPNTVQLGDITKWKEWNIEWSKIDLVLSGSPCQGFSFAGKQLAFDDPRSKLFFVFYDILKHIQSLNPNVKFLLENVRMKKEYEEVITNLMQIRPLKINSALVSAQNRVRLYWTNIGAAPCGLFGDLVCSIPQPEDKGILLKDILEKEVDEKYYLSNTALLRINRKLYSQAKIDPDKTGTLNTKNNSGQLSVDSGTTLISDRGNAGDIKISNNGKAEPLSAHNGCAWDQAVKVDILGNPKSNQDKASCFTAGGNSGGNHSDMDLICVAMRGRNPENPTSREAGINTEQMIEPRQDAKTNCLTCTPKDNLIMQLNSSKESGGKQPYQQNRIYDENGIMPALNAEIGGRNNILSSYRIRRLTVTECARLQTIPDWYKWECSNTQQYRMLGNGWTVDVIKHILKHIL